MLETDAVGGSRVRVPYVGRPLTIIGKLAVKVQVCSCIDCIPGYQVGRQPWVIIYRRCTIRIHLTLGLPMPAIQQHGGARGRR